MPIYYLDSGSIDRLEVSSSLLVSGSAVISGSLSLAGGGLTGSLYGTASWAQYVVNGGGNAFPYTGSAQITGSLGVTGSLTTQGKVSANTDYNGFALNVGGVAYVIGGSVWTQDGYGYANSTSVNTGMFPDSTHNITFKNNNSTTLYINSSGNVGINTTSPIEQLDVFGNQFLGDGTVDTQLYLRGVFGTSYAWKVENLGSGLQIISTSPTSGSGFNIDFSGNVGINTTSPTGSLHVFGDTTTLGSVQIVAQTLGGPSANVTFRPLNSSSVNTNYIFDTNPNGGAYGGFSVRNVDPSINQTTLQISSYIQSGDSFINVPSDQQNISFRVNGNPKLFISGSGDVGIGVTNPAAKLTVLGADNSDIFQARNASGLLGKIESSNGYGNLYLYQAGGNPKIGLQASGSSYFNADGGKVGIGTTSPNATLNIVTPADDTTGNAFIFKGSGEKEFVSIAKIGYIRTRASDINGANIHFADNAGVKRIEVAVNSSSMTWYSDALASNFLAFQHSTGNIGIGTENPNAKLDVNGNAIVTGSLTVTQGITGSSALFTNTITAQTLVVQTVTSSVVYSSGSNTFGNELTNVQAFTGSLRVTGSGDHYVMGGNVGIGATNPTAKLYVRDGADTNLRMLGSSGTFVISAENDAGSLQIPLNINNAVRITATGDVGIGTTNPGYKLDVSGSVNIPVASWYKAGGVNLMTSDGISTYTNVGTFHYFEQAGNVRMVINSTGDVGINTTAPAAKLDVSGSVIIRNTANSAPNLTLQTTDSTSNGFISFKNSAGVQNAAIGTNFNVTDTGAIEFISGSTTNMVLRSTGTVGIGTTDPQGLLDVYSPSSTSVIVRDSASILRFAQGSAINYIQSATAFTGDSTADLYFSGMFGTPVYMAIKSTGYIGVGKNNPNSTLDVNGNTIVTGSLNVTAGITGSLQGTASFAQSAVTSSYPIKVLGTSLVSTYSNPLNINSTNDVLLGANTGEGLGGSQNSVIIGNNAGSGSSGFGTYLSPVIVGHEAGAVASTANYAVMLGYRAGYQSKFGVDCVYIGDSAGQESQASLGVAIGPFAGSKYSGSLCVFVGNQAGSEVKSNITQYLIAIGDSAFYRADYALRSIGVGYQAGRQAVDTQYGVFLGDNAGYLASRSLNDNFLGSSTGFSADNVAYSNFVGYQAGYSASNASYSNFIGYKAGFRGTGAGTLSSNNTIIGTNITLPNSYGNYTNLGAVLFVSGTYSTTTGNPFSGSMTGGRVGVNTLNPNYSLDVSGSGNFTSGLIVTGSVIISGSSVVELTVLGDQEVTGSLRVTNGLVVQTVTASFTGSLTGALIGTASWAVTASNALTASSVNRLVQNVVITGSLIVSGTAGAGVFSKGGTVADVVNLISTSGSYYVWRAPYSASVVALYGRRETGSETTAINARRSSSAGYALHTASNLVLGTDQLWTQANTVQNTNYAPGDSLEIIISGSDNKQVAVQVDFIKL